MENSRVEVELHEIKKSLEKSLVETDNEEQIFDQLCALDRVQVTPKLIKETKLGNTLAAIRGKFKTSNAKITEKTVALMASWKKIMEASMHKGESGDAHDSERHKEPKKESHSRPTTANFVSTSGSGNSSGAKVDMALIQGKVNSLPASRRTVFNILLATLSPTSPHDVASVAALSIEEALNKQQSADSMLKAYTNKAKSLAFNLKKNDALRQHVVCGTISSADLVCLSAADLASHEQKAARERLQAEEVEGRRSDWLEAHKQDIQADIGIDPSNTWDYDGGEDGNNSEPDVEGD